MIVLIQSKHYLPAEEESGSRASTSQAAEMEEF